MIKENIEPKNDAIEQNQQKGVISSQGKENKQNVEDYEDLFLELYNNNSLNDVILKDYLDYYEKYDEQLRDLNIVYEEDYEGLFLDPYNNNSLKDDSLKDYLDYYEKYEQDH